MTEEDPVSYEGNRRIQSEETKEDSDSSIDYLAG